MLGELTAQAPRFITPLKDMCVGVIARNEETQPCIPTLPNNVQDKVVTLLALDLDLEQAGTLVRHESYWRRRAQWRWANCQVLCCLACSTISGEGVKMNAHNDVTEHGGSWKQLYFERNLEEALENFDAAKHDINVLRRLIAFSRRWVHSLRLQQFPAHLDLGILFEFLYSTLASLTLSYGMRNVQLNYEQSLFGIRTADCRSLSRALASCETLVHLDLRGNLLDDDKVRQIVAGLSNNCTVTHLDLRHNKIADRGARSLVKLLSGHSLIGTLNLKDNLIQAEGGRCLARAIQNNQVLQDLNVRLNRLGEDGGVAICEALRANSVLRHLDIGANGLGPLAGQALAETLHANTCLQNVDVSCNQLGPEASAALRMALDNNWVVQSLEMRMSGANIDEEAAIAEILRQRMLDAVGTI